MQPHDKRDFDAKAGTWDEEPRRVQLAREVTAAIEREVPLSPHMTALDYGCGTGLVTLGLQPRVGRIVGADSSRGMLDILAQKLQAQGLDNVTIRHIDLASQEQLEGAFDLIVSSMTMHHVCDTAALVSAFVRALRPGGWLALADLEAEDGTFHDDPTGVCHHGFARDYIQGVLIENGCCAVRTVPAATVSKPIPQGGERHYPIFLAVGRKSESPA